MIVGYHLIFGMYGFWLPNDPRGSWSQFVGAWELFRYGRATTTDARRSVAHVSHDAERRRRAKRALKRPPVRLTGEQARIVGRGFADYFKDAAVPVWACAILPDHVHLAIGRAPYEAEKVIIQLKGRATAALIEADLHPFGHLRQANARPPKCFARSGWTGYLDPPDVDRAIRYVEHNPVKEGLPRQRWHFVGSPPSHLG